MNIILMLAPASLLIALVSLGAFWWTVRNGQYDDPAGDAARILCDDYDETPGGSAGGPPGGSP
jgi:cbb3-type cytochrome oxidase maturation protein